MTYSEVIKQWKESVAWVNGVMNPYVIKEFGGIRPDPTYTGGYIARFDIIDRTFLIDDEILDYTRSMYFQLRHLNDTEEEKEKEAKRLKKELDSFLGDAIAEREKEQAELRNNGKKILTSNPYAWK